jgi:hypothetical protein
MPLEQTAYLPRGLGLPPSHREWRANAYSRIETCESLQKLRGVNSMRCLQILIRFGFASLRMMYGKNDYPFSSHKIAMLF